MTIGKGRDSGSIRQWRIYVKAKMCGWGGLTASNSLPAGLPRQGGPSFHARTEEAEGNWASWARQDHTGARKDALRWLRGRTTEKLPTWWGAFRDPFRR
jgi:hypothetical protein